MVSARYQATLLPCKTCFLVIAGGTFCERRAGSHDPSEGLLVNRHPVLQL